MSVCGCVCVVLYDATAITFANVFSWFLYAKAVQTTFGRRTKLFCDGSNVVNKWRSAYSPVRNSFDKFNGLKIRSLAGSEHMKRMGSCSHWVEHNPAKRKIKPNQFSFS